MNRALSFIICWIALLQVISAENDIKSDLSLQGDSIQKQIIGENGYEKKNPLDIIGESKIEPPFVYLLKDITHGDRQPYQLQQLDANGMVSQERPAILSLRYQNSNTAADIGKKQRISKEVDNLLKRLESMKTEGILIKGNHNARHAKRTYSFAPRFGKREYSFAPRMGKRGKSHSDMDVPDNYQYNSGSKIWKREYSFAPRMG